MSPSVLQASLFCGGSLQALLGKYSGHIYLVGIEEGKFYFRIGSPADRSIAEAVWDKGRNFSTSRSGAYLILAVSGDASMSPQAKSILSGENPLEPFQFLRAALGWCGGMGVGAGSGMDPFFLGPDTVGLDEGGNRALGKVVVKGGWQISVFDLIINAWKKNPYRIYPVAVSPEGWLLVGDTNTYVLRSADDLPTDEAALMALLRPKTAPVYSLFASACLYAAGLMLNGARLVKISADGVLVESTVPKEVSMYARVIPQQNGKFLVTAVGAD